MMSQARTHAWLRTAGTAGLVALGCATAAMPSAAAPSPPKRDRPPAEMPTSSTAPASDDSARIREARAEVEQLYAKGYDLAQEAKALDKAGKAGDAKKKFGKALKQFEAAVERDATHYQSWNMVGFCARHTGDLKKAFAAYQKCLVIAPDYEEAHEYLGEAYLQSGDIANAKIQLAWLRAHDSDEADELAEAIQKVAPGSIPARPDSAAARDSTTAR